MQTISVYKNGKILSQGCIGCEIYIWILIDTTYQKENRTFIVKGTGDEISETDLMYSNYIGSVIDKNAWFVWHIWEYKGTVYGD